jgi:hypothetical protein
MAITRNNAVRSSRACSMDLAPICRRPARSQLVRLPRRLSCLASLHFACSRQRVDGLSASGAPSVACDRRSLISQGDVRPFEGLLRVLPSHRLFLAAIRFGLGSWQLPVRHASVGYSASSIPLLSCQRGRGHKVPRMNEAAALQYDCRQDDGRRKLQRL